MWLTNYFNYLLAAMMRALEPSGQSLQFPAYRKVNNIEVNTGSGTRSGVNGLVQHNQFSHVMDAITIGPIGSLSTPEASVNNVSSQIIFGTGTTPVSEDDYMLENMITTGLSFSISSGFDPENKSVVTNISVTCTGAAKDVSEIGLAYDQVLLYRKVLDTPIHLEVGDSFVVKLTVDLGSGNATVSV